MKIERTHPQDAEDERRIVSAMIMSTRCLRVFRDMNCSIYFQTRFARTVADWCLKYFEAYNKAPKSQIQHIFETESDFLDQDTSDLVEKFLESLSQEFEKIEHFNTQYWIDFGESFFKAQSYKKLARDITKAVDSKEVEKAETAYQDFHKVQVAQPEGVDVFDHRHMIEHRLITEEESDAILFRMPGALGELIGPIERDTFIGVLAREKAGKSWLLMEMGFRALREGCNVVLFDVGDMTQRQSDNRYYSYLTSKPYKSKYEGKHLIPVLDCLWNQDGRCEEGCSAEIVKYDDKGHPYFAIHPSDDPHHIPCIECKKEHPLKFRGSVWWQEDEMKCWTWSDVRKRLDWYKKKYKKGSFQRVNWPMDSVRVTDIENWIILNQERNGFLPDVVLIDYADILLPENAQEEFRHRENMKWKRMRYISQRYHCSVITATQSDAAGYKKKSLDLSNFSEDKRKYGHVTHFFAINKTKEEEDYGLIRMGALLLREDEMAVMNNVTILQNLRRGRFYTGSFFGFSPKLP